MTRSQTTLHDAAPGEALAADGLPPLRDVIARHDLAARKSLGQNFLLDLNLTGRIARAAGAIDDGTVVEIGPGPGGLTRALLYAGARKVIAIERDPRALPALAEIAERWPGRLEVIEADALEVDVTALGDGPRRIVANLPYNVATPLLLGWLKRLDTLAGMTLMFQKEVVDRLVAKPRTKDYGRLSVITQWLCHVEPVFDINPRAFTPPPKVVSTVVNLTPRSQPLCDADFATLEKVTAAAFGQRRKMLRASLKTLAGGDGEAPCARAGLAPTARAEELSVEDFCALARCL
ncbi:Dimethyladenosine transferase [Caenispirillum salinarum AK4]|uniref:Ribosomal RNA small subunit methyltransferase A n=1 Tax=Caenispirillum salinarum AK4 TaxID=1238182 RepID=K9GW54_9PROT|nr:16S rRNA (adenine(1518)-N(6)/adenine(1519)-N(6))-dimethyltransferase RsmA [Caenispirillum salinarum]EKV30175.1 Dimethyladenosine transferase [Caenispirillum salinarum AK4]